MASDDNKKKALEAAIAKLEKDFGKGTVMKKLLIYYCRKNIHHGFIR